MAAEADSALVAVVREGLQDAMSLMKASERLRGDNKDTPREPSLPGDVGVRVRLCRGRRGREASLIRSLGSVIETREGVFPPPLQMVEDDVLSLWDSLISELSDFPLAVARLSDLLWERRWGDQPHLHARSAIDANMLATTIANDLEATQFLVRALELSRAINDIDRESTVLGHSVQAAQTSLSDPEPKPGVTLRLIEALLKAPPERRPLGIDVLLDRALEAYGQDPHLAQEVLDLRASLAKDPDSLQMIREEQVRGWRAAAERATGLVRMSFLQRALDVARLHGLVDIADEIRRELQEMSPEDLDLKTFSASIQIPEEQAEQFIESFVADDWRASLDRVGAIGPPSGDYDANTEQVVQQMRDFPLQFLVSRVVLGPENVPILVIQGDDQHREAAVLHQEAMGIAIGAHFRAEALERIRDRFGVPTHEELTESFTTDLIAEHIAERLARALELFWDGQFDESALVVLPRIEAAVRSLARGMGLVIIVEAQGVRPGRVKMLGELLRELEGRYLDESWRRYLVNALVAQLGTNLRNIHLHGLSARADRSEAAILIQIACHLRLIKVVPGSNEQPPVTTDDSSNVT